MKSLTSRKNTRDCVIGVVYATWCPHCQTLVGHSAAEYENSDWYRVKKMLDSANDKGIRYLVDKTESEEKAKLEDITKKGIVANGFPTIYKYYSEGNKDNVTGLEYYRGGRDINSILRWARNHAKGTGFKFSGGGKYKASKRRAGRKTRRVTKT